MTKYCQKAVHYGVSLARKYGAELFVIHVIHNPFGYEGWNLPIYSLKEDYKRIQQEAKKDLDRLIDSEKANGMAVKELIREGEPTKEVLKVVKEENIDILILLAHEEGRLEHFLFGRSNEALIRRMPCSILMVKKEPEPVRDWIEDKSEEDEMI
jgi:nucleotide-binding universal stress UspA family protein